MGIDGIGKKGGVAPPAAPATSPTASTGKKFSVDAPAAVGSVTAATALEQLKSGAIDLDQYMEIKLEESTAHLKGLPAKDLDVIKDELRFRMKHDPFFVGLVESATGRKVQPKDE